MWIWYFGSHTAWIRCIVFNDDIFEISINSMIWWYKIINNKFILIH